jgi:hypothetical protein
MKKLAILGTSLLIINGCSFLNAPAASSDTALHIKQDSYIANGMVVLHNNYQEQEQAKLDIKNGHIASLESSVIDLVDFNNQKIENVKFDIVMIQLLSTAGRTPYVYSGSNPNGWDCSGLTMWFYAQLGIDIPHSASAQTQIGELVEKPQVGDIIVVREPGRRSYHHSMLYIGNNKVIHSGLGRGDTTEILSLDNKYFNNVDMKIVRVN